MVARTALFLSVILLVAGCGSDGAASSGDAAATDTAAAADEAAGSDAPPSVGGGDAADGSPGADAAGDAAPPAPLVTPELFADVHAFMEAEGIEGSTEDLAFGLDGRLYLGVPGGLLSVGVDGGIARVETTGDALVRPLGIAFDGLGDLWIADSEGKALRHMALDGTVTTVVTEVDGEPLGAPNHLAIDRDGHVHFSDPCRLQLFRYDPAAGAVIATEDFDVATEGGPNGVALSPDGGEIYTLTENTVLLCGHAGRAELSDPIAGLFAIERTADGYGARRAIATRLGLFGDGLAFASNGDLYGIVDTESGLQLEQSAIWIFPADGGEPVLFAATDERVYANLLFGDGAWGSTTLYIALLALPPFVPATERGVMRADAGVTGLPLLP